MSWKVLYSMSVPRTFGRDCSLLEEVVVIFGNKSHSMFPRNERLSLPYEIVLVSGNRRMISAPTLYFISLTVYIWHVLSEFNYIPILGTIGIACNILNVR